MVALTATDAAASDTLPWTGESAIGANQPYQHGYSATDLLRWNPADDAHAEFLRAKVPLRERNAASAATQRDRKLPADTRSLTLAGDYGTLSAAWVNRSSGGPVTVRVESLDTKRPFTKEVRLPAGCAAVTLTVLEDGRPKSFATTYNSGAKPYIIRGRTTRAGETVTMTAATSEVVAILEDYAGNKVTTVLRAK